MKKQEQIANIAAIILSGFTSSTDISDSISHSKAVNASVNMAKELVEKVYKEIEPESLVWKTIKYNRFSSNGLFYIYITEKHNTKEEVYDLYYGDMLIGNFNRMEDAEKFAEFFISK